MIDKGFDNCRTYECVCAECGRSFTAPIQRRYCSEACIHASIEKSRIKGILTGEGSKKDALDNTIAYCKKLGISYAEYQKIKTLNELEERTNGKQQRTKANSNRTCEINKR